ncbi:MAG: hypothetical protein KDD73_12230 [Anaerolineales bacterium]|nr:hypothetical protein [Anaerolineales bacterium]
MAVAEIAYRAQVLAEIERIPPEYLPPLLKMVEAFRESVALPTTEESFRQGWAEAMRRELYPLTQLWADIEDDEAVVARRDG